LQAEQRVDVFAYFKSECAALAKALEQQGRTVELITGETKASERLAIRRRFGDVSGHPEPTVLVAQVRTMSLSVNELVTAQHAVYASPSVRRADWVQSRGRLDRQGQTKPVTYWNVYSPGSVGEVMLETHKERGIMEKALLDHIRAVIR
jgi:SNF2 family DNA or RNA helicase